VFESTVRRIWVSKRLRHSSVIAKRFEAVRCQLFSSLTSTTFSVGAFSELRLPVRSPRIVVGVYGRPDRSV
jgi:hypothetical protein